MESMSAKRLNSTALPSITGFAASAPQIAQPQDGGAVGDHGDEIALGGVVVGARPDPAAMASTGTATPGRVGERQVALGRHRLGRRDLELAGAALAVEQQRLLIGEGRPGATLAGFRSHFISLYPNAGTALGISQNVSGTGGPPSRDGRRRRPMRKRCCRAALNMHAGKGNACKPAAAASASVLP